MADGGKLAVVKWAGEGYPWGLYVAGLPVASRGSADGPSELHWLADRINAAVEAEVERRPDEITKGVA